MDEAQFLADRVAVISARSWSENGSPCASCGPSTTAGIEALAEVGADQGHFGAVGADTVRQIEVLDPRPFAAVGGDGRPPEVESRRARLADGQARVDDVPPPVEL